MPADLPFEAACQISANGSRKWRTCRDRRRAARGSPRGPPSDAIPARNTRLSPS